MNSYVLSVLVENKFGVLARIAGLFSARGFNISSLAVAETESPDTSRMTIVVNADERTFEQVKKQLNKLIDVISIQDFTKKDFSPNLAKMMKMMYRDGGAVACLGFPIIPLPLGQTVGGTTTINSGTCFRTPDYILNEWGWRFGIGDVTPEQIAPYYNGVEIGRAHV